MVSNVNRNWIVCYIGLWDIVVTYALSCPSRHGIKNSTAVPY